jgi:hypothetical protein
MPKVNPTFDDPFVPVVRVPLSMPDGSRASRSAIVVDPAGEAFEAGVVSETYQLIQNETVHCVAMAVLTRAGMSYQEGGCIFDGKKYRQRWLIDGLSVQPRVGDLVRVAVDAFNSYDGSSLFGLSFNAQRLVCSNGMVIDFMLGSFKFRHFGQNNFQDELEAASASVLGLVSKLEMLTDRLQHLVNTRIDRASIQGTFKALNLSAGLQADVFMQVEEDTSWGLYNAFTNVLTKANTHRAEGINRQVGRLLMAGRQ